MDNKTILSIIDAMTNAQKLCDFALDELSGMSVNRRQVIGLLMMVFMNTLTVQELCYSALCGREVYYDD